MLTITPNIKNIIPKPKKYDITVSINAIKTLENAKLNNSMLCICKVDSSIIFGTINSAPDPIKAIDMYFNTSALFITISITNSTAVAI